VVYPVLGLAPLNYPVLASAAGPTAEELCMEKSQEQEAILIITGISGYTRFMLHGRH
jgi:hypothetical protein